MQELIDPDAIPTPQPNIEAIVLREAHAVKDLCEFLSTNKDCDDQTLADWATARGWNRRDLKRWQEKVAAQVAHREGADLTIVAHRLATRFERIADAAETKSDFASAIKATEAQGRILGITDKSVVLNVNVQAPPLKDLSALTDDQLREHLAKLKPAKTLDVKHERVPTAEEINALAD